MNALVLAVGITGAVDLRRLQTPQGVALRWVQAAVLGGCDDYLSFSISTTETRARDEVCHDLQVATQPARNDQSRIGIFLGATERSGMEATVTIAVARDGKRTDEHVHLVRTHGSWKVVRDSVTCGSVGCP